MKRWKEMGLALNRYIRPATFPLALRLVKNITEFPEGIRRPQKDFGVRVRICQGITMSRKYGWTVGMTVEDIWCVIPMVAYGWYEADDIMFIGKRFLAMNYARDEAAARRQAQAVMDFSLKKGECAGIVVSPLEWTRIEPDIVMVYCNPAQLMRLIQGTNYTEGKSLTSVFTGRAASCTQGIIQVVKAREPKVVLPGNGDRVWAMTQDDEMLFVLPVELLGQVIEGLEVTHKAGIRYPIPVDVRHEPTLPAQLREMDEEVKKQVSSG